MILTVQSCGGNNTRYRLGINIEDSKKYFKKRKIDILISIGIEKFHIKTSCGKIEKEKFLKGFDLYSKELSQFIIDNNWNNYVQMKPTKIDFNYENIDNLIELTFISVI